MGFKERTRRATAWEKEVVTAFQALGYKVAVTGAEITTPEFFETPWSHNDPTALMHRFFPDGIARTPKGGCFYWESKASRTIERTAYEQYMRLAGAGHRVILIFAPSFGWVDVKHIRWLPGNPSAPKNPADQYPIDEAGWICPRLHPLWSTHYSLLHPEASGTPYKWVDPICLHTWAELAVLVP